MQELYDIPRVRNPKFLGKGQWLEGAGWDQGKDVPMPPHWWDLHGTSFAPKAAKLKDVMAKDIHMAKREIPQTPVIWLLRGGDFKGGSKGAVGSKIFLQAMAMYVRRERPGVRLPSMDYPTMLADMRGIFSDSARFAFQDQSVPNATTNDQE